MPDTKISALTQAVPLSSDIVPFVSAPLGAATTEQAQVMVAGSLILLEEHTTAGAATIDFTTRNKYGLTGNTFQSDFDVYLFELLGILPATNNVGLQALVTTNAGSTWDTSAVYARGYQYGAGNNTTSGGGATGEAAMNLSSNQTNAATGPLTGWLKCYQPLSASAYKRLRGQLDWVHTTVDVIAYDTALWWKNVTAITGLRFQMTSGNIIGTIRCYGLRQ